MPFRPTLLTYMAPQKKTTEDGGWIDQQLGRLIKLFVFLGFILGALQMWVASSFVTKAEMEKLRTSLEHSHEDHMDDYHHLEKKIDEVARLLRDLGRADE